MRTFLHRLSGLLHHRRAERDLADELEFHIAGLADEFEQQGMPPAEARQAARRAFGGIEQVKEQYRDRRGVPWIETTLQDLRYGARGLRRSPGFTLAAVLSLALGIGANSAIFSLVNTLLLRRLPVREPSQLVSLYRTGGWGKGHMSYPLYQALKADKEAFGDVLARSGIWRTRFSTGSGERVEFLGREFVSTNYFEVLGLQPELGRLFSDRDGQAQPVAVLSHAFWQARLGGDPAVVGRRLSIDEQPFTVIGVAPPGFQGVQVDQRADVWVPLQMYGARISQPGMHWLWTIARPGPGVTRRQLQARADVVMRNYLQANYGGQPDSAWHRHTMEQRLQVRSGDIGISLLRETFEKPLLLLMCLVGLVLVTACANVASLLLARGAARRREIAVRLAMGAGRRRLIRQGVTESAMLGCLGMLAGIGFGWWAARGLVALLPALPGEPRLEIGPDGNVLVFTAGTSLLAVLLFGLVPALRATRISPELALRDEHGGGASRWRVRGTLVAAQVALAVVLVATAVLFGRSLRELTSLDLGFRHSGTLTFRLGYPRGYQPAQTAAARQLLLDRLSGLPGTLSVSYGFPGPYQTGSWTCGIRVPGSARTLREAVEVHLQGLGGRYFETLGAAVLRGRDFDPGDRAGARRVAIVNRTFSRTFWDGRDPVGRILTLEDDQPIFVVGEVADLHHGGVRERCEPVIYLPAVQSEAQFDSVLLVRSNVKSAALLASARREIAAMDPRVTLEDPRTLGQRVDDSVFLDRLVAWLGASFGALALLLAALGVYGVISFSVLQRTSEIGIRMALGANRPRVVWLVVRTGLGLVCAGILAGIPLALLVNRLAASLLFGVGAADRASLFGTVAVLLATTALAAWLPASRAASIAPAGTLRHE